MKKCITVFLLFLITTSVFAGDCKPDLNTTDKITKQGNIAWEAIVFETGFGNMLMKTSSWRVTVQLGRYSNRNLLTVFLLKSEESAQNASFESQYRGEEGKDIFFGFSQGQPIMLKVTAASTISKMDDFFGQLMTTVTLGVSLTNKQVEEIKKAFTAGNINAFRLNLANGMVYEKDIKDNKGEKLSEKVRCFLSYNDQNPVKEEAMPVIEGAKGVPDDLPRDQTTHKITFNDVVSVEGINKDQLYDRARNWMIEYYKNEKFSIDNKGDGKISRDASFLKVYAYPGQKPESNDHLYNLTILLKDGKYKYVLTDIVLDDGKTKMPAEQGYDLLAKSTKIPPNYKKYVDQMIYSGVQEVLNSLKTAMMQDVKKGDW